MNAPDIPAVSIVCAANGRSIKTDEMGMQAMQARAYASRGEQYLLIKSPPASGKSRALMFIALDKLLVQGLRQVIVAVPEKTIGASFNNEPLTKFGFHTDWQVKPNWNLCNAPGGDEGKVGDVGKFLNSNDRILICTHATFRFALDRFGTEAFDNRLLAIDEFHHVSANPENKLGAHLTRLIARDKTDMVAMTGSYFRGDAEAVLSLENEARFKTVTYTWYEQLNGYSHLKSLDMGYHFYAGAWADSIRKVLNPEEKTILHIPNVNSRESSGDKYGEVDQILDMIGTWEGTDDKTGFHQVRTKDGKIIKIADLVDNNPVKRDRVSAALKDPAQKNNRDHVDIIIALGMAKEGFDWIWCEHALTVGYRASMTEIVQIIGRATRDAPGKTRAKFTNLIAEPDASEESVAEAVNDTLKAIAGSLLMEQVMTPKFTFAVKTRNSKPVDGFDYGDEGYRKDQYNVGEHRTTGEIQYEFNGFKQPISEKAKRICKDPSDLIMAYHQDNSIIEQALFDKNLSPEELNREKVPRIIAEKHPDISPEDREAVRQHMVAAMNVPRKIREHARGTDKKNANTAFIDDVRKFALDVRELDIDLIDRINPFDEAYAIVAKTMSEESLEKIIGVISAKKSKLTLEEARDLTKQAVAFKEKYGRLPSSTASDSLERKMAEGVAYFIQEGRKDIRHEHDQYEGEPDQYRNGHDQYEDESDQYKDELEDSLSPSM